jgi:tRNA pseudouridine synthase 10
MTAVQEPFEITDAMLSQARKALDGRSLCTSCLGRLFGKTGHGLTNGERGRAVLGRLGGDTTPGTEPKAVPSEGSPGTPSKCWLCEGKIGEIPKFAGMVADKLVGWEFDTFLVGTKLELEVLAREEELWVATGAERPELLKSELNREIGKLVEGKTGKKAEFASPDIVAIVDTRYDFVALQVASLYIYGRYKKLITGIPQTKWPCRVCMGKGEGCSHCGGKGKLYETSVEELIAGEAMKETKGSAHSFHGMGREDIDARMLGNGRPFILEVKEPKIRGIDFSALETGINRANSGKVEVSSLRKAHAGDVEALKNAAVPKTYVITVKIPEWGGGGERLKREVGVFRTLQVSQQTPARVAHRRADIVRKRKVLEFDLAEWSEDAKTASFRITAESGTYIKELVTGDGGRTLPSVSEVIGKDCTVLSLDVVQIHDSEIKNAKKTK